MKRWSILILALCLTLLAACGEEKGNSNVYEVEYQGTVYTVDQENGTIEAEGNVYQFEVSSHSGSTDFRVTYPDGSSYYWTQERNIGYGGWSNDYDPNRFIPGDTLWDILGLRAPRQESRGHPFIGLFVLAVGILNILKPRVGWYLSHGWRYKDAEPSDAALSLGRLGGVACVIIGVICFFI